MAKTIPNISEWVKPTPGQPRWYFHGVVLGLDVQDAGGKAVHRQFGEQIRQQTAQQDGQVGHSEFDVLLDEIALQLVRRPAHRSPFCSPTVRA
jgi:hypothetical protein